MLWTYLKLLFRLLFSPTEGWQLVSASKTSFEALSLRGYLPLAGITALSEFVPVWYIHDLTFLGGLGHAIAIGGGMYASLYGSRIFLEMTLSRYVNPKLNKVKTANVALYLLGLDCLYIIFSNLIPGTLTFLLFLPLLSITVLFRSGLYMGVSEERMMNYLILSFAGVIAVPALICWLLMLII